LRYVLPVFPCLFVWASRVVRCVPASAIDWRKRLVAAGLASTVCSSLWIWPHSLSYFNEGVGGPWGGHAHLGGSHVDSNIDCGQDMLGLKHWLESHPQVRDARIVCMGPVKPELLGLQADAPPAGRQTTPRAPHGPQPGWFLVSVNNLHLRTHDYDYFSRFQPVATVGYSIYIYHVTPAEANRVRRELGLDEWVGETATP